MCHVQGCDRDQYCKGLCRSHYYRFNRYGNPLEGASYKEPRPVCRVEGCSLPARIKGSHVGYCLGHGRACRSCGDPSGRDLCEPCHRVIRACDEDPGRLRAVLKFLDKGV